MTTTDQTPATPLLPTDAQPIAWIATTRYSPVREMTEMLNRRFGQGLQVQREHGRTVWLLPVARKQSPSRASHLPVPGRSDR